MPTALREALARAARNALQVLVPLLALASAGQIDGASAGAVVVAGGLAAVLSLLKSAAGVQADPRASLGVQLAERAAAAAAGAAVGLIPLDLAGVLAADWRAIATAIGGAAVLSVVSWSLDHLPADAGAPALR